ncbi:hypothetical protein HDU77_011433 [Chytriomyces hyalinus]|nr:hypothetical protein HDU77_011433 [Chytriomyces hyalinus]
MIRVVLGISGGVDSSVSALLLRALKKQPVDLHAVYMHNWDTDGEMCPTSSKDFIDARKTTSALKIPLYTVNFTKEYWTNVFQPMVSALEAGLTPNPDIQCNQWIKFGAFANLFLKQKPSQLPSQQSYAQMRMRIEEEIETLAHSKSPLVESCQAPTVHEPVESISKLVGTADFIATGHYARNHSIDNFKSSELVRALDRKKDQTYFLSTISQASLERTIFPVGNLKKTLVKEIASKHSLEHVSRKRESMGICFINPRVKYGDFVGEYMKLQPGAFVTVDGDVKGVHDGIQKFTVGQRARLSGESQKWFIADKDIKSGNITVVPGSNHPALRKKEIRIQTCTWISGISPLAQNDSVRGALKVRHKSEPAAGLLKKGPPDEGMTQYIFEFDEPEIAIAGGQHAAFYIGEVCLGGGTIK